MLGSILVFLLVLSILVLVHELGHFLVARHSGVMVEEFGFGLPPRLFGKKFGETLYSINALPFGGFVKLYGEDYDESTASSPRSFLGKKKSTRFAIVIAGVIMNFLLAIVAFSIVYSVSGIPRETGKVDIVGVEPNTPAASAQIVVGDRIISVDGKNVFKSDDVTGLIKSSEAKHTLLLETGPQDKRVQKKVSLGTIKDETIGSWYMGIVLTSQEVYYPTFWKRPFYGIYFGFRDAFYWGGNIVLGLTQIVKEVLSGHIPKDVSGPVAVFAITTAVTSQGIIATINFIGILSVNLAILNVLPFPALDGGRLAFIAIEKAIGRKIIPKVEATINMVGFIILIIIIVLISVKDVMGIIAAGGISGYINSVLK